MQFCSLSRVLNERAKTPENRIFSGTWYAINENTHKSTAGGNILQSRDTFNQLT